MWFVLCLDGFYVGEVYENGFFRVDGDTCVVSVCRKVRERFFLGRGFIRLVGKGVFCNFREILEWFLSMMSFNIVIRFLVFVFIICELLNK